MSRRLLPILALIGLVSAGGGAHGLLTDRWGASADLQQATTALGRFPKTVGGWVSVAESSYDPDDMARAGIRGYVGRTYRDPQTGDTLQVLTVCGRAGPISVHTPDVCYVGAGYRVAGSTFLMPDPPAGSAFRTGRFVKAGGVLTQQLDIYWAWSRDGSSWSAPDYPRVAFAWAPTLYKLYVVRSATVVSAGSAAGNAPGDATDGRVREFLAALLPQLKESLAAGE